MTPILGIWASSKVTVAADAGAMFPLQVITVGSAGASSVTFSNIPNTYTHLQLRVFARTNRSNNDDQLKIGFNSDTAANYTRHIVYGDGSSVTAAGFSASTQNGTPPILQTGAASQSNLFGANIVDILDYANTNKYSTVRVFCGVDWNGGGYSILSSSVWLNTAAISSVTFTPANGTLVSQYSSFALYGIKGA